jgi:hypothetical protein
VRYARALDGGTDRFASTLSRRRAMYSVFDKGSKAEGYLDAPADDAESADQVSQCPFGPLIVGWASCQQDRRRGPVLELIPALWPTGVLAGCTGELSCASPPGGCAVVATTGGQAHRDDTGTPTATDRQRSTDEPTTQPSQSLEARLAGGIEFGR